jgi:predicted ABC-type ATPase
MPQLFIIAGPPGIGKSTNGKKFISTNIGILNHDALFIYYRAKGEADYEDLSNLKANDFIQQKLSNNDSFGVEINLGYDNHYELLRYIKKKFPQYEITVCMFFTNDLNLCLDRAAVREKSGGHSVAENVIREMYANTLALLEKNTHLVNNLLLVDVTYDSIDLVFELNPREERLFVGSKLPKWVLENFPKIAKLSE